MPSGPTPTRRRPARPELPVDRLGRRHQADQGQDRRLRRVRHAAEGRGAAEARPDPVPDRHRRRRAGRELEGIKPGELKLDGPMLADIYLGKIKKWNDPAIAKLNPGVKLPDAGDRRGAPLRRLGHDLHLRPTTCQGQPGLEGQGRRKHRGRVAGRRRRQGQRGRRHLRAADQGSIGYVEYAYAKQNKMTHAK